MKNAAKFWRNFKEFKETDEILAKFWRNFRPSIPREIGHKKFHTNSSTHQNLKFHAAAPKFFHSDTLGVGGPEKSIQNEKCSSEQVFLNNFCLVPDSLHREEAKVRANFSKKFV